MKIFVRGALAACALAICVGSASAVVLPFPTASDFIVTETLGPPGHYSVTNNAVGWYIYRFDITHGPDASNPEVDRPGWLPFDNGFVQFSYVNPDGIVNRTNTIVPGETYDGFLFNASVLHSDWIIYVTTGNNDTYSVFGSTDAAAVPVPAALPLFASGLAALGWFGMRRKRKVLQAAA